MNKKENNNKSTEEKKQEAIDRTFTVMFKILLIFGLPAFAAYWAGKWLDNTYNIEPYGTLAVLFLAFMFSWALVIKIYKDISKEFKEIEDGERNNKK